MNFSFVPSLQRMAATRIVAHLWNRADVVALIAECDQYYRGERWKEIEKEVNEKVRLLRQPAPLSQKLSNLVLPIGDQIRKWKWTHVREFRFKKIPREFRWTSRGTVDKKGTAEAFVRDPTLPEGERYGMACLYCLEWDGPVPSHLRREPYPVCLFEACWTYDRMGDATALDSVPRRYPSEASYRRAFRVAVQYSNVVAAEYYFLKLSPVERKASLCDVRLNRSLTDFGTYRFLLLQRSEALQEHAIGVLESLLDFPWQPFFVDVARRVRNTLECREYFGLLSRIVEKIGEGYEDYGYGEVFGAFWGQIPVAHKKYLLRARVVFSLLRDLFRLKDEENILLVLRDASPEEREDILLSDGGVRICSMLADDREWNWLELFIGECLSTGEKIIHFREECERRGDFGSVYFRFLDELICSENSGGEKAALPVSS